MTNSETRVFKYYDLIMAAFVTVLLCSNLIAASKVCRVSGVNFGGAVLFFPLSYLFGDILTEVYGYARSRKVVWAGFAAMSFATFMAWFVVMLPAAPGWPFQHELATVFDQTPRIVVGSLIAYFVGEFANSFTMAKMKIFTQGKHLWSRTIGSTIVGEGVDSILFYPIAFLGTWPTHLVIEVAVTNYIIKVLWETVMTPLTYKVVAFLKKSENIDFYDYETQFTPFSLKT